MLPYQLNSITRILFKCSINIQVNLTLRYRKQYIIILNIKNSTIINPVTRINLADTLSSDFTLANTRL